LPRKQASRPKSRGQPPDGAAPLAESRVHLQLLAATD
jgi:hypothetical protein